MPSHGDLYLDLEGDPFAGEDGMDYLFGLLQPSERGADGGPLFHAFWSRDAEGRVTEAGEKAAFEATIDKIIGCLDAEPDLHVYHYAPYEPSHLGKLMGRYNTRQDEVDRLFRGDVLVDLYGVVRQGIRASVESYSIKKMEPFYGFAREIELARCRLVASWSSSVGCSWAGSAVWVRESSTRSPPTTVMTSSPRWNSIAGWR